MYILYQRINFARDFLLTTSLIEINIIQSSILRLLETEFVMPMNDQKFTIKKMIIIIIKYADHKSLTFYRNLVDILSRFRQHFIKILSTFYQNFIEILNHH